ncbi:MAG: MerR family DNA-binding transcriptional regulator [Dermatophilaceae bacterium]
MTTQTTPPAPTVNPDMLLTTADAAILAGVSEATIRSWQHRGILTPAGHTPRGQRTYRIADISRAALR